LYGVITRENSVARRFVLNLAGLFQHSFGVSSSLSARSEEMKIVRAYLEIEEMRLGSKLQTEFDIDESALSEKVPVLSIQPLVENAVQHGVACRPGNGFVRLMIRRQGESILVAVSNSGVFGAPPRSQGGHGIGMANVRRRLTLCYGDASDLDVSTSGDVTTVRFLLPARSSPLAQGTVA
jgi:LytS/YehU family sensor histidine kinase